MADTKQWRIKPAGDADPDQAAFRRAMRKGIKRAQRRRLKQLYAHLTPKQRDKFLHGDEKMGIKQFVASIEKES